MPQQYRLIPELIPATSWGYNLRSYLKPDEWKSISKYIRAKASDICEVCGNETKSLEAHEIWGFNDSEHIQYLIDVVGVCPLCHRAFHIGQTISQGNPYLLRQVYEHIKAVNRCNEEELRGIIDAAKTRWRIRSQYDWKVEVNDEFLAELLEKGRKYR